MPDAARFTHARYEHFITHSQCQRHKYKQNKTGTTDTDYKDIKRKK